MVIPLTSAAGYHGRHAHILVHFYDGNPDMVRKTFQPELKDVAEEISRRAVAVFRGYKEYMRGDPGAPTQPQTAKHFEWLVAQQKRRDDQPLNFEISSERLPLLTEPREEQEVVALFNQLLGARLIRGIQLLSVSCESQYDCCYLAYYPDDTYRYSNDSAPLGVATTCIQPGHSKPLTMEFKYTLDGLISDFHNEIKFESEIDSVVVWELGNTYKTDLEINSLLVLGAGSDRQLFGATHRAKRAGGGTIDVICLRDLLRFLQDREEVEAEHKVLFGT